MSKTILFNPISVVHDRHVGQFRGLLRDWHIRCIYNTKYPWFSDKQQDIENGVFCFSNGYFQKAPKNIFDGVSILILFTTQPRVPPCGLIEEATLRNIPIVVIEEVYQMMLQQGVLNNYLLPMDHFFVGSDYEKDKFIDLGISSEIIEVTGCMFRNRRAKPLSKDVNLKNKFALSNDKHILTFCLDALSSEVGSLAINRKLINHVFNNMPHNYELLIKPHPENQMRDFAELTGSIPSRVKITDPKMPIDEVLDVTDLLLNRGNSQVIIDALEMGIPVVLMPLGKRTFFHGILDGVIADNENLLKVINYAQDGGIDLYADIFGKYLSISPRQATMNIINRIEEIYKKRETHKSHERLLELALFWAWMGYVSRGQRILSSIENFYPDRHLFAAVCNLLSCRVSDEDLAILKRWAKDGYKASIIQSLWIKITYLKRKKLSQGEKEWLVNFPPGSERARFMDYAILLCWCYFNSGMYKEAEAMIDELYYKLESPKVINRMKSFELDKKKKLIFDMQYLISCIKYKSSLALKSCIFERLSF